VPELVIDSIRSHNRRLVWLAHDLKFEAQVEVEIAVFCLGISHERKLSAFAVAHSNIVVSELLVQYIIERHRLYTTLLFSSVSWLLRFFQDRHGLWEGRPSQLKKCSRTTCSFIRLETV
jgi:hypothetical protein